MLSFRESDLSTDKSNGAKLSTEMAHFAKPPLLIQKRPPRVAPKCPLGARRRKRGLQGFKRLLCLSDLTLANREFSRALQPPFSSGFRVLGDEGGWKGAAARPLPVRRAESGTQNIIRTADSTEPSPLSSTLSKEAHGSGFNKKTSPIKARSKSENPIKKPTRGLRPTPSPHAPDTPAASPPPQTYDP
ncbi:hypothetical protein CH06BL_48110 [Chromobacterium haemolyticum]|nr:hypothetical protein CH06BL_48110 [Chromobacterium haemolyticum]